MYFYDFGLFDFLSPGLLLAIGSLAVIQLVLFIVALISLLRKKVPAGEKALWLVVILLVNIIGPIIYFAVGSSMLDEKAANLENEQRR